MYLTKTSGLAAVLTSTIAQAVPILLMADAAPIGIAAEDLIRLGIASPADNIHVELARLAVAGDLRRLPDSEKGFAYGVTEAVADLASLAYTNLTL